jgi:HPt (histidine-containing phosphotransfer) domain-containing protein
MNIAALARETGLEESEYYEILELFAATARKDMDTIKAAIESGDAEGGSGAAHSLKGASANLGLSGIYEKARTTEEMIREGRFHETGDAVRALDQSLAEIARLLSNRAMPASDRDVDDDRR